MDVNFNPNNMPLSMRNDVKKQAGDVGNSPKGKTDIAPRDVSQLFGEAQAATAADNNTNGSDVQYAAFNCPDGKDPHQYLDDLKKNGVVFQEGDQLWVVDKNGDYIIYEFEQTGYNRGGWYDSQSDTYL